MKLKNNTKKVNECKDDTEHVWMYNSTFCDRCNKDFEEWLGEIPNRIALELVVQNLNKVLDEMWKERKITRNNSIQLYNRMMQLVEDRGYIIKHAQ